MEDLYDKNVYGPDFLKEFGVDPKKKPRDKGKRKWKWSKVMEALFSEAGKPWDDDTKIAVKNWLADYAVSRCETILHAELVGPLDSVIRTAEDKLQDN